jgi:hypothetical protein
MGGEGRAGQSHGGGSGVPRQAEAESKHAEARGRGQRWWHDGGAGCTCAGWAVQQHALGLRDAQRIKQLGVLQRQLDDLEGEVAGGSSSSTSAVQRSR